MKITNEFVNVSHSIGIPFGGIGTGYAVFGKYGFLYPNFDNTPHKGRYNPMFDKHNWDYIEPHDDDAVTFAAVRLSDGDKKLVLQKSEHAWIDGLTPDNFETYAYLPYGACKIASKEFGIKADFDFFSPMKPHDLDESHLPVLCMTLTVENEENYDRVFDVELCLNPERPQKSDNGDVAVWVENNGKLAVKARESASIRLLLAWFYPDFETSSPFLTGVFKRYYCRRFTSIDEVIIYAAEHFDDFAGAIETWHKSFDVPASFKRLWFSSLSSVITSAILGADPIFFEVESPHPWVNTMDVCIYSTWLYMVNWPEIEDMDLRLFHEKIPKDGEDKGFVWHSLWTDKTHYVEEPTYIVRVYRDFLWNHDEGFLKEVYPTLLLAFERVYQDVWNGLIEAKHGNQSYDVWKMPGVNAYVNLVWIYAIYAMRKISERLGQKITVAGKALDTIQKEAVEGFDKYLWNGKYYNCFYRTPGSREVNEETSVFTDAMFGRWIVALEKDLPDILSEEKIEKTVRYAFKNNLVLDKEKGFKGWSNGMLDGGIPLDGHDHQYHVKTCWLGAQLDLASLLAEYGDEAASLEVFDAIESSLHNNHLAVGEWNQSVFLDKTSGPLPEEVQKDTPRFPAYPRYKSSWELLIRLLGFKASPEEIELKPFKSLSFAITDVTLAGTKLTVKVEKNWTKIFLDGKQVEKAVFPRDGEHEIVFA